MGRLHMLMRSGGEAGLRYAARPGAFDVVPVMAGEPLLPADA